MKFHQLNLLICSFLLALSGIARATDLVVTSSADSGEGSLRDALAIAGFQATEAVNITFSNAVTHINVTTPMQVGNSAHPVTLDGGGKVVLDGNDSAEAALELSGQGVTVRGLKVVSFRTAGIVVLNGAVGAGIYGCLVGTDGNSTLGNSTGVLVLGGTGVVIGGPGANRNVISGNTDGIKLDQQAAGVVIQGNYIGLTPDGLLPMPNDSGITVQAGANHLIGGDHAGEGNVCSGNRQAGVQVIGAAEAVTLKRNYIGVDKNGDSGVPNGLYGLVVIGPDNVVIGAAGAGNVISANVEAGILLSLTSGTTIQGNYIGVDATGEVGQPNGKGIDTISQNDIQIGGTNPGEGNVISANSGDGLRLQDTISVIQGNIIGRSASDTLPLGNWGAGINVTGRATIGGLTAEAANIIANNGGPGVAFVAGTATTLRRNSIYDNTGGANILDTNGGQTVAVPAVTSLNPIVGTAEPLSTVEFFVDSGAQAKTYVGAVAVNGQGTFSANISLTAYSGKVLAATATTGGPNGQTSYLNSVYPIPLSDAPHNADQDGNHAISLSELLRVIQFYNSGGIGCALPADATEDGFAPGAGGNHTCAPYSSDYNPQDWVISLSELLRAIQFFNVGGYYSCLGGEDGFCPLIALP